MSEKRIPPSIQDMIKALQNLAMVLNPWDLKLLAPLIFEYCWQRMGPRPPSPEDFVSRVSFQLQRLLKVLEEGE